MVDWQGSLPPSLHKHGPNNRQTGIPCFSNATLESTEYRCHTYKRPPKGMQMRVGCGWGDTTRSDRTSCTIRMYLK